MSAGEAAFTAAKLYLFILQKQSYLKSAHMNCIQSVIVSSMSYADIQLLPVITVNANHLVVYHRVTVLVLCLHSK